MSTPTLHHFAFMNSDIRGDVMYCSCGEWELPLEDIRVSPMTTGITFESFRAGVSAGRVFEQHVTLEQGIEKIRAK